MAGQWFESVAEAHRRAKKELPKSVYGALVAGSEAGATLEDNMAAFRELEFLPHVCDLPFEKDLSTTVMGQDISMPVIISPTGVQAVDPEGEVAVARAAKNAGTAMGLSSFASRSVEDVIEANEKTFFQMYWVGDRETLAARAERAKKAGAKGLIVTLDWSFSHGRDWGSPAIPEKMDLKTMIKYIPEGITRPRWGLRMLRAGKIPDLTVPNIPVGGEEPPTFFGAYGQWMFTPPPTWADVAWLREQWDGPFCVKGITRVDDAKRAVDAGATAIQVSNHGGNNLDSTPAPIRVLPGIVEAVGRRGRGHPRRRHPARQRRRQGPGARRPRRGHRARLPLGPRRQRPARRRERLRDPAQRHRLGAHGPRQELGARARPRGPDHPAELHPAGRELSTDRREGPLPESGRGPSSSSRPPASFGGFTGGGASRGCGRPDPGQATEVVLLRFEATWPNECWQSDFTHHRLSGTGGTGPGRDIEIITWLDDHSRYALRVSAHRRITAAIVAATFGDAAAQHGFPASTLTDNGMVYTVRLASRRGGRTALEHELRRRGIVQKNSRPNHPTTCGKVERFQQTLKNWLRAQPRRPTTIAGLSGGAVAVGFEPTVGRTHTRFRGALLWPLGHATADKITGRCPRADDRARSRP